MAGASPRFVAILLPDTDLDSQIEARRINVLHMIQKVVFDKNKNQINLYTTNFFRIHIDGSVRKLLNINVDTHLSIGSVSMRDIGCVGQD